MVLSPRNWRAMAEIWPPKRACEIVTQPGTPAASSSMLFLDAQKHAFGRGGRCELAVLTVVACRSLAAAAI